MPPLPRQLLLSLTLASTLALGGCLFGNSASVSGITSEEEGVVVVNISTNSFWLPCTRDDQETFSCAFFSGESLSTFNLSTLEVLLFLFLVDPLVIQVPDTVTALRGSFNHPAAGGPLAVSGPFASVAIDRNRSLTAEPGTGLYVVALPESAHDDVATFDGVVRNPDDTRPTPIGFNLQFNVPTGVTSLAAKVLAAAHARTQGGQDFYLPVFPCADTMAAVPALTVPIPAPGTSTDLDLSGAASVSGCSGETFEVGAAAPPPTPGTGAARPIPLLGPWSLGGLAALFGALAAWRLWRRP